MTIPYLIKGIPLALRLALFAAIELAGIAVQVMISGGFIPGTLIMAAGLILVFSKGYTTKPEDLGYENWKPVSFTEIRRIQANLDRSTDMQLPFFYRPMSKVIVIFIALAFAVIPLFADLAEPGSLYYIAVLDTFIIMVPLLFSGLVTLWKPSELVMKLRSFEPVMKEDAGTDLVVTPYLRFDQDKEGREIPEDLRFMVELKRAPEDFVGAQFQIAINSGPNGAVPYMYAVFLCSGKGKTFNKLAEGKFSPYIREAGGDDDYGTVVIRQQTSGKGYHTDADDCRRLYRLIITTMRSL
jgi:hypothetical protein